MKPAKRSVLLSAARLTILVAATAGGGEVPGASRDGGGMAAGLIPAERLADWRPGIAVGVPGGIPTNRTHIVDVTKAPYNADNSGVADAQPAIQKAVSDAKPSDVVYLPAGTYRIHLAISLGSKSGITIRGAGPGKTVIMPYRQSSGLAISPADGGDWWYPDRLKLDITGSPKKGDAVLAVGDTRPLDAYPKGGIGQICQLSLKNDLKLPVVTPGHWEYMRRQLSRIVAKTATTVTISPQLLYDLPAGLAPVLRPGGRYAELVGIEDLTVDGTNSTASGGLISINASYGCWVKNVTMRKAERYIFGMDGALRCEVRHCYIGQRKSAAGPNGGGLLMGVCSSCLIEDNIVAETFPDMEVDSSSGNVFAYNFCDDRAVQGGLLGCSINSNHGGHGSFNLYEGNVAPRFQCDGYHGSASHDTAFRNWFHGTSTVTDQFWICVNLNRFTRCYNIVGNVLGRKGHTWLYEVQDVGFSYHKHFIYSFGFPNMGNGWSNGKTAQPSRGRYWADWEKMLASTPGKGPGPSGFQEWDLDVKATTLLVGNYNYRDNGVPASESLGGAALPKSLYLTEKPAWFGDLPWPPFGPDTDFQRNKIPAEVRFEAMNDERHSSSSPGPARSLRLCRTADDVAKPPDDAESRISKIVEADVIATHAYQVGMVKAGRADAAAWSACGLSAGELRTLVEHQRALLGENPQAIQAWVQGGGSHFDPAKDLEVILKSPLRAAAAGLPVNVYTERFKARTRADALGCRAVASLLQMMLDVDRDGDVLQQMYALYVALGLPVHTEKLGMPEKTDEEFMAVAKELAPQMCRSPVDASPGALRMMFRKMWNWGHRHTGQRDRHVLAGELLAGPDIRAIAGKLKAMPAQKIAVIGHSFTMEVNWASPSAFVPIASDMLRRTNPAIEVRQWQAGGLNPSRADCRQFYREALAWKPDRVLLVLASKGPRDLAALDEMVGTFSKNGAKVMMFDTLGENNAAVGTDTQTVRGLSARYGMAVIEIGPLLVSSPQRDSFVCLDGIHMTEPYHRLMAKEWLKYLAGAREAEQHAGK